MQKPYHMRRKDREIRKKSEIFEIIKGQELMTIAMSRNDEPYLITVNFGFDEKEECFYFHCAKRGKKIDYLNSNPKVWGTIIEDNGYVQGDCEHKYRSVHFEGIAEFIDKIDEKRKALEIMIEFLEDEPEKGKKEFITKSKLEKVGIIRIKATGFTAKGTSVK